MKAALEAMLEKQGLSAKEFREKQEQRQRELEMLVKEAIARIETKKQHDANSAHGGATFEEAVVHFVAGAASGNSYVVEATGGAPGHIPRSKVGDAVVHFTEESAFSGCKVVVEAKHDRSYTVAKSLEELEIARKNRGASVGLFVMSASHAPAGFPEFARYGSNILVTWDHEDGLSDYRLRAALTATLCLATRKEKVADEGDIQALERVRIDIEKQLERLDKIRKANDSIKSSADKIENEVRLSEKELHKLVENAEKTLRALNVELANEAEEMRTPIRLSSMPPVRR
jgi:hypothetical protein